MVNTSCANVFKTVKLRNTYKRIDILVHGQRKVELGGWLIPTKRRIANIDVWQLLFPWSSKTTQDHGLPFTPSLQYLYTYIPKNAYTWDGGKKTSHSPFSEHKQHQERGPDDLPTYSVRHVKPTYLHLVTSRPHNHSIFIDFSLKQHAYTRIGRKKDHTPLLNTATSTSTLLTTSLPSPSSLLLEPMAFRWRHN